MSIDKSYCIREINTQSDEEIQLVAQRMRQTLVEVLGKEKGAALYSMEWLRDRVLWHLDSKNTNGKVYVVTAKGQIIAHAIARVDQTSEVFGYFSTLFVEPSFRRTGVANALVDHVERWFRSENMPFILYNTASSHHALINLFEKKGFSISLKDGEMIQLKKIL